MEQYKYLNLSELSDEYIGNLISIAGRIHNIRDQKKVGFLILRKNVHNLQCILVKNIIGDIKYKELSSLPCESYIQLYGKLNKIPNNIQKIKSCSYQDFEFMIDNYKLISKSQNIPFTLDDANNLNMEQRDRNNVSQVVRLDNRFFELRAPIYNCIFESQSDICKLFRDYLNNHGFMEIHSPKIIGTASEGGAQVFSIKYFDKNAYLAQSPQLYKQMCINSDFDKVFEIGGVYRAENTNSNRHLTEYIGLDVELEIEPNQTYYNILNLLWNLLDHIIKNVGKMKYPHPFDYIKNHYNFEEILYPKEPLIIDFKEGVKLLNDAGFNQSNTEDLSTENERELGKIIKNKYGSDLFILEQYPVNVRPFYTMPNELDNNYTNSYDVIMRGEEICSGAQRIHDYDLLLNNIKSRNINPESLQDYLNSFANGSKPHGGFGIGLERLLMLIYDLKNVRKTSLYTRDPNRLAP